MNLKNSQFAIEAQDLYKNYGRPGQKAGLNGFDLAVRPGTVCGLLGPNGAGKTTAVKILATLLQLDRGQASVAGFDITRQARQVRENIGLVGQYAAVDEILTGRQNLMMFGQLNHLSRLQAQRRADDLLEQFELSHTAKTPVSKFSGGMRRRLDLAASLIVSPAVLFVDEPTTGLDPVGRREVWNALRALVAGGTTILLTTQYLEEADQLADHIAILKEGRIISEDTPDELKATLNADWLDIILSSRATTEAVMQIIQPLTTGNIRIDVEANRISVPALDRIKTLVTVATALSQAGIEPQDLSLRRPTLEEVFIHLTGPSQPNKSQEVRA